jgi:hypothetical protein
MSTLVFPKEKKKLGAKRVLLSTVLKKKERKKHKVLNSPFAAEKPYLSGTQICQE